MAEFIGFRATMMKALIHAPGDGLQRMKLSVWCSFVIAKTVQMAELETG